MLYVFAYIQNRLIRRLYVTLFENPTKMSQLNFRQKISKKACATKGVEINGARFARNVVKMRLLDQFSYTVFVQQRSYIRHT